MFTGIIRNLGTVTNIREDGQARALTIATPLSADLKEGDSVAVNGACLTVTTPSATQWVAHVMPETLRRTNIGSLKTGELVNVERPLVIGDRLDGHFVQGHVDGVSTITAIAPEGDDQMFSFNSPPELLPYLIPKGSVALDGVSLTVIDITNTIFRVSMMPYTIQHTTFQQYAAGAQVNVEVDMIGKYVIRLAADSTLLPYVLPPT